VKRNVTEILHHLGEENMPFGSVTPPIFQTSIFQFDSFDKFKEALSNEEENYLYTRGNNPTVNIVEEKIAALEHGQRAKLFASGIAAISSGIMAFLKSNDHVVCVEDSYSWTKTLLEKYLKRFGISHAYVDGSDIEEVYSAVRPNTKVIYLESPTTFTFKIQDLENISAFAKKYGIKTIIDNTWATPYFQNPLDFGIDLVVHSSSKYFGGHSDVVAGVIVGSKKDISHIFNTEFLNIGAVPDPFASWLILRGLRTLHIRMERHFQSTMKIIDYLSHHPAVEKINYPFYKDNPQLALAKKQMRGGSGLFSIKLATKRVEDVKTFTDNLRIFKRAVSWGGYESLIVPYAVSHKNLSEDNISIVRIHVGLEDPEILIDDLERSLKRMMKK
jgi:cystathionine beta-lyase